MSTPTPAEAARDAYFNCETPPSPPTSTKWGLPSVIDLWAIEHFSRQTAERIRALFTSRFAKLEAERDALRQQLAESQSREHTLREA